MNNYREYQAKLKAKDKEIEAIQNQMKQVLQAMPSGMGSRDNSQSSLKSAGSQESKLLKEEKQKQMEEIQLITQTYQSQIMDLQAHLNAMKNRIRELTDEKEEEVESLHKIVSMKDI